MVEDKDQVQREEEEKKKKKAVIRELSVVLWCRVSISCLQPGAPEKLLSESTPSPGRIQFCLLVYQSFTSNIFALFWVIYPELERCKMIWLGGQEWGDMICISSF